MSQEKNMQPYSLYIVSHLPEFKNKQFKKHLVDGIETIGVFGNEPFEILFRNDTRETVQVKLSIDGTDIISGKPATTAASGEMFVVSPYDTLSMRAWPETNKGGAQFIFTDAKKSVAVNTHGNLNSQGVIAAAVYSETHKPLARLISEQMYSSNDIRFDDCTKGAPMDYLSVDLERSVDEISDFNGEFSPGPAAASFDESRGVKTLNEEKTSGGIFGSRRSRQKMKSLAAVGAGKHIDQQIKKITGFVKPALVETVQVRFLWWDDLISEVKSQKSASSGFPGDTTNEYSIMSLGSTPRIEEHRKVELSRF
jgi:hypothetical protein